MKLSAGIALGIVVGLLLGIGGMLLVPHGAHEVVYAGGTPSGNGDVNATGAIDIADAIYLLTYLFAQGPAPEPIVSPACDSCCLPCPQPGLPATGQTQCYDADHSWAIPCDDPNFPGQDGFYQKGCASANRFIDNQDGTVTDTCTGLMWQKDTADVSGNGSIWGEDRLQWHQALRYCANLEFAAHSDWRLPNVRELQSIVDYGTSGNTIDPIFDSEPWGYWSSTTADHYPDCAWFVEFEVGVVNWADKSSDWFVRAVRG